MHILKELPAPIQQSAKQMLNILQEELSYATEQPQHNSNLKSIVIE
ncbi:hypothetical protein bcere0010_2710 [Bacillus cereus ATCC 4342]|nr:hypothetical protein bcere0010_2710 [Bacillus cereus ATCC 4342]